MNLITLKFGMFLGSGEYNRPALFIDFNCKLKASFLRMSKQSLQHMNHILISMIFIIQQNDMIRGQNPCVVYNFWFCESGH